MNAGGSKVGSNATGNVLALQNFYKVRYFVVYYKNVTRYTLDNFEEKEGGNHGTQT
jgi:hypothetical protein